MASDGCVVCADVTPAEEQLLPWKLLPTLPRVAGLCSRQRGLLVFEIQLRRPQLCLRNTDLERPSWTSTRVRLRHMRNACHTIPATATIGRRPLQMLKLRHWNTRRSLLAPQPFSTGHKRADRHPRRSRGTNTTSITTIIAVGVLPKFSARCFGRLWRCTRTSLGYRRRLQRRGVECGRVLLELLLQHTQSSLCKLLPVRQVAIGHDAQVG